MPTAPVLPPDRRPPIRETPYEPTRADILFASHEAAVAAARVDAETRGRQQVSRRHVVEDGTRTGFYWVVQDVR